MQNVEGMYAVQNSQAQGYNLSHSPMWSSGSTTNTEPPKFSEDEDRLLHSAVASNTPFPYIKAFILQRTDISTEALVSHACKKGALWAEWEDDLVRKFLAEGKEPDHELITDLQKCLPWRDHHTVRARVGYLKKQKLDGEVPQSEQPHGCNTQGDHLGPLSNTVAAPNHSDTDPYTLPTESVNRNFGHTSADSPQAYPNDRLMNLHGFGTVAISTDGPARFQQHHTHNVQDNTSGHLPFVSLLDGPAGGFVGHTTISAANYYNNNNPPIDQGEYQDMSAPNEAFPQAQQYSNHGIPQYDAGHPTAAPNYPRAGLPPFQPAAAIQGIAGFNTSSAPSYDSFQWANQPIPPDEPGHPEQGSSNVTHEASVEDIRTAKQLEKYVPEIRRKVAQNWSWNQVNAVYCPQYNYFSMRDFLKRRGCQLWNRQQDRHLKILRRNRYDWGQICGQLIGPPRTEEEVEVRFRWLTGEGSSEEGR